jgi:hypothetical protein
VGEKYERKANFLFSAWALYVSPENTGREKNMNIFMDEIPTEIRKLIKDILFFFLTSSL